MDTTILVDKQYEVGKELIEKLDGTGYKYPIALWINMPERNDWMLLFGVPKLKRTGSRQIYKKIHEVIMKNNIDISLNDITLSDTTSDLCKNLKALIKTGTGINRISLIGNYINGQQIPDSIIYRVN